MRKYCLRGGNHQSNNISKYKISFIIILHEAELVNILKILVNVDSSDKALLHDGANHATIMSRI